MWTLPDTLFYYIPIFLPDPFELLPKDLLCLPELTLQPRQTFPASPVNGTLNILCQQAGFRNNQSQTGLAYLRP